MQALEQKINKAIEPTASTQSQPAGYITRTEAAKMLFVSLNTLAAYTKEGKVKAYRIGNRVLYKAHEIETAATAVKTAAAA